MAGNSSRRGAIRKPGTKKGSVVGSGGQKRKGLEGKGPTPKATERTGHASTRRTSATGTRASASRTAGGGAGQGGAGRGGVGQGGAGQGGRVGQGRSGRGGPAARRAGAPEYVGGRNPVVEALRAGVPVRALYVASRIEADEWVKEAVKVAGDIGLPILEVSRVDLDRMTSNGVHQGLAIQVPAYDYAHPDDLLDLAFDAGDQPLLVALDGVTDPRNLGAVVRSVAAFGGHGVVVPERRAAGMTASAWKVSAGAAARVRVARATNLTRALTELKRAGCFVVGLDADGDLPLDELEAATGPLVIVVGSEGKGLSRLVRETCDVVVSIPMAGPVESLNAGVAAGVALYEVARRRG
jgi:23S rRNA (guanosine2251-2'-O)-methyltransferase